MKRTPEHIALIDVVNRNRDAISYLITTMSGPDITEIKDVEGICYILELIEHQLVLATGPHS